MKKKSKYIVVATAIIIAAATPNDSNACYCTTPETIEEEMSRWTYAVFVGEVKYAGFYHLENGKMVKGKAKDKRFFWQTEKKTFWRTEIATEDAWKGNVTKNFLVSTRPCGFNFEIGEKYLVFAYSSIEEAEFGLYSVSMCSRTKLLSDAAEDIKWLNENMKKKGKK